MSNIYVGLPILWEWRILLRLYLSISLASMYAPTSAWQKDDLQFPSDELAREVLLEPAFNDSFIVHGIRAITNVSDRRSEVSYENAYV